MNRPRQEESKYETNGMAKDADTTTSSSRKSNVGTSGLTQSELQGFLLFGAGAALIVAPWLFPTLVRWAVALTAVGLLFVGSRKAHLIERAQELFQNMRNK